MRVDVQRVLSGLLCLMMLVSLMLITPKAVRAEEVEEIKGTVTETMNSGGYTYILLDRQGKKEWFAVPESLVKVGDEIQLQPGVQMGPYTSPTLKRTFDKILFSGGISGMLKRVVTASEDKAETEETAKVAKAEGPDAYTVAEIFAQKEALSGKKAVVRGKVVKSSQFEDRQWLRIVDGSGSSKKGDHKLVVITTSKANKGDIIQASGTVTVGKAFGALTYEVLLEEAKVEKKAE